MLDHDSPLRESHKDDNIERERERDDDDDDDDELRKRRKKI